MGLSRSTFYDAPPVVRLLMTFSSGSERSATSSSATVTGGWVRLCVIRAWW